MPELSPAPSINDTRTQSLLTLIERLGTLDLSPILIYRIDSVPDSALPFLAWQFDILSPLWQLIAPSAISIDALTDIDSLTDIDWLSGPPSALGPSSGSSEAQRALLKLAIPLHRERGTPAAIKRALASLGWAEVSILEGQASWGGTAYPASEGWAVFQVMVNLDAGQPVPPGATALAQAAVNLLKPARAWLDSFWFVTGAMTDIVPMPRDILSLGGIAQYQIDTAPPPEDTSFTIAIVEAPLNDSRPPIAPIYNRHYVHSGITYGSGEPIVADQALIMNGIAVIYGG